MKISELVIGDWFVHDTRRYVLVDIDLDKNMYTCVYKSGFRFSMYTFSTPIEVIKLDCPGFITLKPNTYYRTVTGRIIKTGTFYKDEGYGSQLDDGTPVNVDINGDSRSGHVVDKEVPDPGPDYNLLQDSDELKEGDEFYYYATKEWLKVPDFKYRATQYEINGRTVRRPKKKPETPITFTQVKKLWGQTIVSKNSNKKQIVYEVSDSSIGIRINHVELSAILYRYTMEDGEEIKTYLQRCN